MKEQFVISIWKSSLILLKKTTCSRRLCFFYFLFSLSFPMMLFSGETKLLEFGQLVDGTGKVLKNAWVLVEKDRIGKVTTDSTEIMPLENIEKINLSNYTAIAGLIDVHTHLTYYWDQTPGTNPWTQGDERSPFITVFLAQENARKILETGVTTVRDLGAFDPKSCERMDIAMRDLINQGKMVGPRMFVCGYALLPTTFIPQKDSPEPLWGQADGVDEILRVIRREIAAGADVIKMFASTGSADDVTGYQIYTDEEIEAAVKATQVLGKRIAVTDLDNETIQEMVKRGTFYVPTIDHNRYYVEHADEYGYGSEVINNLNAFIERNLETARKAYKAGVHFAMGSDALFTMFGENTRELGWFIKAGMTPQEALHAATINGATLLGMENELGKIAPGYYADIVAVEGNPLKDIKVVIDQVKWVMKAGQVVVDKTP